MRNRRLLANIIILGLLSCGQSFAQDYELSWPEAQNSPKAQPATYTLDWPSVDASVQRSPQASEAISVAPLAQTAPPPTAVAPPASAPIATYRPQPNGQRPAAANQAVARSNGSRRCDSDYGSNWQQTETPEFYDIELSATEIWSSDKDDYTKVRFVEVVTYRSGNFNCEVFENLAECSQYDISLNELQEGDSYVIRVVWADGSNKTVESTIDSLCDKTLWIDEPDYLAFAAW